MTEQTEAMTDGPVFVFQNAYGGATKSATPPMIHNKLRDLRLAVGGLAAKKQQGGPMFPVRSAKELAGKLAQALCDLNLAAPVVAQEVTHLPVDQIPDNKTASGKPVFRTLTHIKATVRIIAEDGSYIEGVGSGYGGDGEDKSCGKASTYAWKDCVTKLLTTPEQDMLDSDDESPSEKADKPSRETAKAAVTKPPEGATHLADVLSAIEAAGGIPDLEAVAAKIKDGTYPLVGADKLRASTAYVARKKALEA